MNASEIKSLFLSRGWKSVEVAAYFGVSVQYLSKRVNNSRRGHLYDCAFLGLPLREEVEVVREARHNRTSGKVAVDALELFPIGRILQAENNQVVEEGARVVVRSSTLSKVSGLGASPVFVLEVVDGGGYKFKLSLDELVRDFHDTGMEE
jgi:hypothetical protein